DEFEETTSNIISTRKLPEVHDDICQFAKKRNPENHPVIMFRKQAVLAAGGYQHFPLFEDYYLWIRMLQNGAKFYNIQESLLYFRFSPAMFKRRGGLKYVTTELRFQNQLRNLGFITSSEYLYNVFIRVITRMMPNTLRAILYKKALRK
ncbi:amylovoran biosynthesis protein AmsE, partial [Bacteroides thetaiotaomicron]|nr:amylovoran biosynthesis protein AmsE [Bacteroides thetaiotaomicron]MBV4377619.1 amylovoran biosynthesis protein AmsE [Bacteroides thetaiotaomicron]MBV4383091.1 amylovoran biosynthesis protein AmsE [Bacteroides thetaiotaomicron]